MTTHYSLTAIFSAGMNRQVPDLAPIPEGKIVNLGAGAQHLPLADNLDRASGWSAPLLPYDDEDVALVIAFHFMEHLSGDMVIAQLREVERVLMVGGSLITVIPHWSCELAHQDLDHRSFWSETTWNNLMSNPYYADREVGGWKLKLHTNMIMGIVSRNLVIVSQLIKM